MNIEQESTTSKDHNVIKAHYGGPPYFQYIMLRTGIGLEEIWLYLSHTDRNSLCKALPEKDRTTLLQLLGRKLRTAHWEEEINCGRGWSFVSSLSVEARNRMLQTMDIDELIRLILHMKTAGRPMICLWYFLSGISLEQIP